MLPKREYKVEGKTMNLKAVMTGLYYTLFTDKDVEWQGKLKGIVIK